MWRKCKLLTSRWPLSNRGFQTGESSFGAWVLNMKIPIGTENNQDLLIDFWFQDLKIRTHVWVMRVESQCNIADWTTRPEKFHKLREFTYVSPITLSA